MISAYVRQSQNALRRWMVHPKTHLWARGMAHVMAGFCLSAAGVSQGMLPLVLGLVWACRGWRAVLVALGGMLGYGLFWGAALWQGIFWTGFALVGVLLLGDRRISREMPLLIPSIGMLTVSAVGLGFQLLAGDTTSVSLYLIRVALGGAAPWAFDRWLQKQEPVMEWLCWGMFALGLAQIAPVSWLGLGYVAAGLAAVWAPFPGAAMVGLAVDLAGVTQVPMTAVVVLSYLIRFLPRYPKWTGRLAPGCIGLLFMELTGVWDLLVLPGLFLGGIAGSFFTPVGKTVARRGETGAAQVKLEVAAGVLRQTRRILLEVPERFVDVDALVQRAVCDACSGCAARDKCRDSRKMTKLTGELLQKPLLTIEELPVRCKKGSRMLAQLRKAQEQLRAIQADRQRQREYREAVVQQYTFLSEYLSSLSDRLSRKGDASAAVYTPVVSVYGNRRSIHNGDRCMEFAGMENQYYIVLCDGMGTGSEAVREGESGAELLRKLLSCGFPPEHALKSLNSICALRDRAGAVTVDLVQICLNTGKTTLYKWGGAASYLMGIAGAEKLGVTSPPPGLSVEAGQEVRCGLTLRKGQTLLLVSDGVEEDGVMALCKESGSPAVVAEELLKQTAREDDATVVTIRLVGAKT